MENSDQKIVRYYRPEKYKGGGCHHIGIEIERTGTTVTVRHWTRPQTFYYVPIEDVRDVSSELKARLSEAA